MRGPQPADRGARDPHAEHAHPTHVHARACIPSRAARHACLARARAQARSINKSLLGLGKCISVLAQPPAGGGQPLVPYRDSVLTWILRDALGGNAHTLMLCAVSACVIALMAWE